ncbi:hypothetical protein ACEN9Z_05200, partial [Stenotrophomonas geniculata]
MSGRLWFFRRWRPRSLQARQMFAASVGLVAFLALAGYALDAPLPRKGDGEPGGGPEEKPPPHPARQPINPPP